MDVSHTNYNLLSESYATGRFISKDINFCKCKTVQLTIEVNLLQLQKPTLKSTVLILHFHISGRMGKTQFCYLIRTRPGVRSCQIDCLRLDLPPLAARHGLLVITKNITLNIFHL